jgi:hypothetical protein
MLYCWNRITEWKRKLELPSLPFHQGVFVFSVSLGDIWRVIAIPATQTLERLANAIIDSVKFDYDHLWEFASRDRIGTKINIRHPEMDADLESYSGDEFLVGDLLLADGDSMAFT